MIAASEITNALAEKVCADTGRPWYNLELADYCGVIKFQRRSDSLVPEYHHCKSRFRKGKIAFLGYK